MDNDGPQIDEIITNNGSIQSIQSIPDNLKKLYKTVWEIPSVMVRSIMADN